MSVGGCVGHHDVAHVDLGAHAGVLGVYDGVFHLLHSEIGGGKVAAVAVELALEGLALVYAGFLGRCYLLLVGDKHLQVLVDCLRSELLRVVFVIKIFKLTERHRLVGYCKEHGVLRRTGIQHTGGGSYDSQ